MVELAERSPVCFHFWHCPHSERHYHSKCHSHRQQKGTLASFPPSWTNMCRLAWYCNRVWTTYSISKQFPNCFQAKANAYMEAIPPFNLFIWRSGNITVLRKLDLRIANSGGGYLVHSDPRWRCISLNLCGPHVSTLFKHWEVTVQGILAPLWIIGAETYAGIKTLLIMHCENEPQNSHGVLKLSEG